MKKSLKFYITLFITKTIYFIINILFKERGTNFPGVIALKLYKDFVKEFDLEGKIIFVTGTNGKTSSSNIMTEILINNNKKVVNNSKGSNMLTGITSTLIANSNKKGKVCSDVFIFETDERDSKQIFKYIKPDYLLCTNLFRDSIKRNGHSEFIFNILNNEIPKKTVLILNGDDLISSQLGKNNKKIFFSINKVDFHINSLVKDIQTCPKCKNLLYYEYIYYNHIGLADCKYCNFKSKKGDLIITNIDYKNNTITIDENNKNYICKLISDNFYNIYNQLGVIATLRTYGLNYKKINDGLNDIKLKKSRQNIIEKNNFEIISLLSKNQNPVSTSLAIDYISKLKGNKTVILLVTDSKDKKHGSEDISWLYDTDFEFLNRKDIKQIIVCGNRAEDLKNRLILGDISKKIIDIKLNYKNIEKLIKYKKVIVLYELYAYDIVSSLIKNIGSDKND